jgi:hypothetical protein
LLASDLGQALARPLPQAPSGFDGQPAHLLMVRSTDLGERATGEAPLQVVRWALEGDRLVRSTLSSEGQATGPSVALAEEVVRLALRYRDRQGAWHGAWQASPAEAPLPSGVELVVQRRAEEPVILVVAVPQGPAPAGEGISS